MYRTKPAQGRNPFWLMSPCLVGYAWKPYFGSKRGHPFCTSLGHFSQCLFSLALSDDSGPCQDVLASSGHFYPVLIFLPCLHLSAPIWTGWLFIANTSYFLAALAPQNCPCVAPHNDLDSYTIRKRDQKWAPFFFVSVSFGRLFACCSNLLPYF